MGSVPSPEVCDILMFDILEEINNRFKFKHKIYYSGRYRDDGFMIFIAMKRKSNNSSI
jgi:hypothetical protein